VIEDEMPAPHRTLWRLLETYHALVYYAPERSERYAGLGLKGGWMGYFATRSAALGAASPALVTACFYGFSRSMVERALPDAWRFTTPAEALQARYEVFDAACRRLVGARVEASPMAESVETLKAVIGTLQPHGRPMFAAHAETEVPDGPHLALFWACTALREYRGDAHIVALQHADISPVESNVLMTAMRLTPPDQRTYRGWSQEEWDMGVERLQRRGWLRPDGGVSQEGQRQRARIERDTDRLVAGAWTGASEADISSTIAVLVRLVEAIVTSGEVPYPNGMGVAPVAELAVPR
jgi:hypothetical protein